ncbi:Uncharacterised protein [Serratia fonticola]|uniref:Uncharacterized protein n=1 Tax=Serratia fonticola TaxID=47917 RepID=A0A4U9UM51_SERFO|nr:Uncharacterised protein [Serratia fonticola]
MTVNFQILSPGTHNPILRRNNVRFIGYFTLQAPHCVYVFIMFDVARVPCELYCIDLTAWSFLQGNL